MTVPPGQIGDAVAALRRGELIGLPTETVYGLGADARNTAAIDRIFTVKGRPANHPLIVHIESAADLDDWAINVSDTARVLAEALWPGPLTLILDRHHDVPSSVSGGRSTIGMRVPNHPMALELLCNFAGGIAAPSANRFGKVSPTTAPHVANEFSIPNEIAVLLDGGPCLIGVESTIVDVTTTPPSILRHGHVSANEISLLIGGGVVDGTGTESRASGMLEAHYQPRAVVHLAVTGDQRDEIIAQLGGTEVYSMPSFATIELFAQELYRQLRHADDLGMAHVVAVLPPPADGLANAIRDRLRKAAHR